MKEQLTRFSVLIQNAISAIGDEYLQTTYLNLNLQHTFRNRGNFRFYDNTLYHFGERVFCYELYHNLRQLIEEERNKNKDFLLGCLLQGELKKHQLLEIIEHFNIERLSKNYTPDFLMHTPGDMTLNASIIEVKVVPDLSDAEFADDLNKILEFITKYNYLQGIFIAINAREENLKHAILHSESFNRIREINIETASRIVIISKYWQNEEVSSFELSEILFSN